ncbi:Altered inheritance of mitochondria protein 9, mitochondrial [Grifola frondosa]|uniref:Altered inheritance of mitochondria protein 9, mitochondrial n=1 Tax=Grifola frondosa TaxID=5627 RepID=A0A1C7LKZ5_GRIFR|nr:Altered inheritance of mitochondria protein 9, mitochondrial [Grifola frondosa]
MYTRPHVLGRRFNSCLQSSKNFKYRAVPTSHRNVSFLRSMLRSVVQNLASPSESDESFFGYTSGRWLFNEPEQLSVRHVTFDVAELKRVAAQAVGAGCCTRMKKTHEGSFNKIFALEFDNNAELIAKIPTALIPPFYTTASEVATMDYARTILGLPVPRVLAWNARPDTNVNPVGAEYILMEKIRGDPLYTRWDGIRGNDMRTVVEQVINMEQRFVWHRFSQIGSLFYKEDVEPALRDRPLYAAGDADDEASERFRVGPLVDWAIWRGSRASLDIDRGPWPDPLSYIRGIIRIEQQWIRQYATPRPPPFHLSAGGDSQTHIDLLERLYAVAPHIIPPPQISQPVLWHTDLHGANIFLAPSGTPDIVGIIDWQGMCLAPLYMQATFAAFLRYSGDAVAMEPGWVMPKLRVLLESAPAEERPRLEKELRMAKRHKLYEVLVERGSPHHFASQVYPFTGHVVLPTLSASRSWYEGSHHLREALFRIRSEWADIAPGVPLPVALEGIDWERHQLDYARKERYEARAADVARQLGLEGDGLIPSERYEQVKCMNEEQLAAWDEEVEGGPYPFQDGAPSFFVGS